MRRMLCLAIACASIVGCLCTRGGAIDACPYISFFLAILVLFCTIGLFPMTQELFKGALNMKKMRLIQRVFIMAMACAVLGTTSVFAAPADSSNEAESIAANSEMMQPGTNFPVIEDMPVRNSGVMWEHTAPYVHARVYVNNTTSETMKVSIMENGTLYDSYEVAPNGDCIKVYNDLPVGAIKIDFITGSGTVSGSVAVRVSDTRF